jgi:hypothetical protein
MDPGQEWTGPGPLRQQVAEWTRQRGTSPRLYPGSLIWCFRKPGRDLRDKVENWLAWRRVAEELERGELGGEYDRSEMADVRGSVATAEEDARDEVWATYRYLVLAGDRADGEGQDAAGQEEADGLQVIDLGAGHASQGETLCGHVIAALKAGGLLNESVGAGYIERHWPPALKSSGAWPLTSLRQSFLNGALTRLLDPDTTLRKKLVEFVEKGEMGLASGQNPDGSYQRLWLGEAIDPGEVSFDAGVFLLLRAKAQALKSKPEQVATPEPERTDQLRTDTEGGRKLAGETDVQGETKARPPQATRLVLAGNIPAEVWNRLGTKLLPKLRSGEDVQIEVKFSTTVKPEAVANLEADLRQALQDLGLEDRVEVKRP